MVLLDNDPFLTELARMFQRSKEKGSVWVTFKRVTLKAGSGEAKSKGNSGDVDPKLLVRARAGNGKKISTVLTGKDVVRFQMSYATILKSEMDSLQKRDRRRARRTKRD
eukprot:TRINITY_DN12895_c0_g1_i1.p1 TRINITY_DN12895_c0_g1~~TRINITY_DN12895_c0_g1_i1.p1  ORF type:complete len:109 (-),score=8.93 TRINITY_DN12895_c0_g1_i1:174-500(-)